MAQDEHLSQPVPEIPRKDLVQQVLDKLSIRLNSFPFAAAIADPDQEDCPLVWTNEAFVELTKYHYKEAVGRNCRFLQGNISQDTDFIRKTIEARKNLDFILKNQTKLGVTFDNFVCMCCVEFGGGHLYFSSQGRIDPELIPRLQKSDDEADVSDTDSFHFRRSNEQIRKECLTSWLFVLKSHLNKAILSNSESKS
ncbi:MAG: PAS domain-containing protein [Geminicoccaceae bacterium]